MKIVVIGGSGLIGTKLVRILRERGHEAVAASPSTGVNILTGEGLAAVMTGAEVVVDVANSPTFETEAARAFFETASRHIIAAETAAAIRHHVALSVVGLERLEDIGYMRAKLVQEAAIKGSKIPYSIVRATQFFEFIGSIVEGGVVDGNIRLTSALFQPVAAEDVAATLADVALAAPSNGMSELGGPESRGMDAFGRQLLAARNDPRTIITDVEARYFGERLDDRSLRPDPGARIGKTSFASWLRDNATPPARG
ncbi:putative secreted protein [Minicystis rosea]|nr:putative secreted protein [Minicystis rosea]